MLGLISLLSFFFVSLFYEIVDYKTKAKNRYATNLFNIFATNLETNTYHRLQSNEF